MAKLIKLLLISSICLVVGSVVYLLVDGNPLEFSVEDSRQFLIQVVLYSTTAMVAIFGYWWTQREQDKRHDDKLYEARWNKTLDVHLEALRELSDMRVELSIKLKDTATWKLSDFVNNRKYMADTMSEVSASLDRLSNHCFFYFDKDKYYLCDSVNRLQWSFSDLESYTDQVLPVPEGGAVENAVAMAIRKHIFKVYKHCQMIDWEIGILLIGDTLERYDVESEQEVNNSLRDPYTSTEEYKEWKQKEYDETMKVYGLTDTRSFYEHPSS
ncbi:hypothetical protein AB4152_05860 [Vibrio breoganii]